MRDNGEVPLDYSPVTFRAAGIGNVNCVWTVVGIVIVTFMADIVLLVLTMVKICEIFDPKKMIGALTVK